jgi:multidrug transporter EmrE-like cation transporter
VTLVGFLLLLLTAICMAVANLLMKTGITQAGGFNPSFGALLNLARQPAFVFGFLLSGVAALMWFRILATQKLSTCYPLFVSLTYSLITLAAFYFLHEKISVQKIAGLLAIIAGITAVARG